MGLRVNSRRGVRRGGVLRPVHRFQRRAGLRRGLGPADGPTFHQHRQVVQTTAEHLHSRQTVPFPTQMTTQPTQPQHHLHPTSALHPPRHPRPCFAREQGLPLLFREAVLAAPSGTCFTWSRIRTDRAATHAAIVMAFINFSPLFNRSFSTFAARFQAPDDTPPAASAGRSSGTFWTCFTGPAPATSSTTTSARLLARRGCQRSPEPR